MTVRIKLIKEAGPGARKGPGSFFKIKMGGWARKLASSKQASLTAGR